MHSTPQNKYLESAIQTATPAGLRLMLIEKAVETASTLSNLYRAAEVEGEGVNEHSLRLLDLINELLGGVSISNLPVEQALCSQVSDLYVFLAQHLVAAEKSSDADAIDEIKLVLEIEAETWRQVCKAESQRDGGVAESRPASQPDVGGLSFEA